jgi:hypothetical protein
MKIAISAAVAPLRREASDRSEMITQALMGEQIEVIERQEKWSLVRLLTDGYEGWLDNKQYASMVDENAVVMLSATITRCTASNGDKILLPAGCLLSPGYSMDIEQPKYDGSSSSLRECAFQFLNAPYLWGGRTVLGIDCSGFSQLVFRLNGYSIPRDAYQQAEAGSTISFVEEARTGDLAFFDNAEGRIIHVGIVLRDSQNESQIIHASGKVRVDVLDHEGIFNREQACYSHKLRIIKRIVR